MPDKLQNTTDIDTIAISKAALVTDLNPSYAKDIYSHARNAVRNSREGDLGTIGNEPSNDLCFTAPYDIIGIVNLPNDELLVLSTDNASSEIGIANKKLCTYKTLLNNPCLNFNKDYPVTGVAKKLFQKDTVVTITDKLNSIRRFELNKISKITSCEEILLFKLIDQPCITLEKGQTGNIPNGAYSVAIAYSVDNQIFSDWYSISNRIQLNSESGSNSIDVTIDGLDTEFDFFTLAVIGNYIDPTTKGATKLAKIIGTYSTKVNKVSITDFVNSSYLNFPLSDLILKKRTWEKAGIIVSNSDILMFADLVGRNEENYQLKAMNIDVEYVVTQVPADYYLNEGKDVGYYRDEKYELHIQGVYNTGEHTDKFHIAGPRSSSTDRELVASADVYEYDSDYQDCAEPEKIERWQVENTAEELIPENNKFICGRRVLGSGKTGFWQSTDLYPDNEFQFGKDANQPIRFHMMPDECKVPRYEIIEGKRYINIIGLRLKNIPKFDNPNIVGYRILRSDRKGGNGSVVARGIMTNMRSYTDSKTKQEVLYSNYTVNDLNPDQYLSSTQTVYKNGRETNFTPLTTYYKDKFSFYSPHTLFEPRYSLGTELKIESEEIAKVTGQFELVHNHPKLKLLNQFAFWISAAVGFIQSTIVLLGKTDLKGVSGFKFGIDGGPYYEMHNGIVIKTVEDLISLSPSQITYLITKAVETTDYGNILSILNLVKIGTQTVLSAGLKIPFSILEGIQEADKTLDIIYNFTGYTDYVYQYNAYADFNESKCIKAGNKRRRLLRPALYIPSDNVSVDDKSISNYFREKTVYLELNKEIAEPSTKDTSRNTISGFGICENINQQVTSVGSAYYVTSKAINPNQYGKVGSANIVSIHSCVLTGEDTPILYGGDCIIAKMQFMKKMQFFTQNIANTNYPNGTEYDYRLYRNIAYPRFWLDSSKYDFSALLSKKVSNFATFNRTTASKYNLDCKKRNDGGTVTRIDDAYMYLSNNCVMDFYVEADYNINFREKTDNPFYSKDNTNLSQIFRSDRLEKPEEFNINRVYSDLYTTEVYALQQREDFDPNNPIPITQPNSVIYSLPSYNLQNVDNWQYFLPANFFSFKESDFGKITSIHQIDQDRLIFLFSKSSPYISMGRSLLKLSNQTITIGDGGLFAQDPRETLPTDNNYAACNSKYAFSNTHLGRFYPSENQGRIIDFGERPDDLTRQGMSYWCKNYMPIFLYKYFPEYPEEENPINGVGYLTCFDSFYETVYICKRDFSPKREYINDIVYEDGRFTYKGEPITLRDTRYFNDISWTLSYSPLDKSFVSWHDWHPDYIIQTDNHFMTVKGTGVWKHNERFDNFCSFYGKEFPFEIQPIATSGQTVQTLRSIEYILEVYKYKNFGRDRFHVLNENFSHLIVKNSEQISPLLILELGNLNPEENLSYPKKDNVNPVAFKIPFFKEENKYRVNKFWDAVNDRGEFTDAEVHLFPTDESGYKSIINPVAIDMNKPEEDRKKFRHYWNEFRLTKSISGAHKFLFKIINIKKLLSPR